MALSGRAKRVRIYVNEGDHIHHKSAPFAIIDFLRKEHAAGATVLRAIEGFAGTGVVHTTALGDLVERLPVVIEWIDTPEQVERLLGSIKGMVVRGLITVEDTEVVHYATEHVSSKS